MKQILNLLWPLLKIIDKCTYIHIKPSREFSVLMNSCVGQNNMYSWIAGHSYKEYWIRNLDLSDTIGINANDPKTGFILLQGYSVDIRQNKTFLGTG